MFLKVSIIRGLLFYRKRECAVLLAVRVRADASARDSVDEQRRDSDRVPQGRVR